MVPLFVITWLPKELLKVTVFEEDELSVSGNQMMVIFRAGCIQSG
jgi:hypothetical protein